MSRVFFRDSFAYVQLHEALTEREALGLSGKVAG